MPVGHVARAPELAPRARRLHPRDHPERLHLSRPAFSLRLKRAVDLALALPGLVVAAPVLALAALAVRLTLGRPVLFRQVRPGLHGEPFTIYKLRTMTGEVDEGGKPLPDEARLTRLGRFLRRTSLDELPELWNVVKGDMSLVGPRPLLVQYLDRYTPEQARRHEVKPGLTGWTQVNGRNALTWDEKFAFDVWYVDHRSLWLDLKVLARTAGKILTGEGISQPGEATAGEYLGPADPSGPAPSEE